VCAKFKNFFKILFNLSTQFSMEVGTACSILKPTVGINMENHMWGKKENKAKKGKNTHPAHLKGKEIGEFYRQRAIEKKYGKKPIKKPQATHTYEEGPAQPHLGMLQRDGKQWLLAPCHRKDLFPGVFCTAEVAKTLEDDVVAYSVESLNKLKIHKHLGNFKDAHIFSLMTIQEQEIPTNFSKEALALANKGRIPSVDDREDLRHIPLVTIDGEDAKDFDDAVFAEPDESPDNPGGWRLVVAIADVSYYVRPQDALDKQAFERGNSVYFPDRVVPMLPETLSNGLCSLKPKEDRACLAVEIIISKQGAIRSYTFKRGLMRSVARLTYEQVQNAIDGNPDSTTAPLLEPILKPLYGAYKSLLKTRAQRGTLDLNIPELKVKFDQNGKVTAVLQRESLKSHQLIEEMMIAANVCAAKLLLKRNMPGLFRVHDKPDAVRVANLKMVLNSLKINVGKEKTFAPHQFNEVLSKTHSSPYERLVHDLVLRCQAQALYAPKNIGHFGLSLEEYTHFTSPIRRYSDLIVHRAIISTLNLGKDGFTYSLEDLQRISEHINVTERRAASAERDTMDRYVIAFLQNHVGETFPATIVGVTKVGIFVSLDATGAQGLIHKRELPGEYYEFDQVYHRYVGTSTKRIYQLGQRVQVFVNNVNVVNCSTSFSLARERERKRIEKREKKKGPSS
jgi:ribonuclease R